eukprot:CAMPEP_0182604222 /NCGR_PEP_ID=MMETSP1324-20130603/92886_1 /TAXON_ID=236786 /ORGANISM="Florenciella sp., Strain RCC1587" /LENGTH=101 /DNA_ID=CAMNT_0024822153 /DNA_START=1019 /DNA_END=1324 /DNA_ORIENTATION=+
MGHTGPKKDMHCIASCLERNDHLIKQCLRIVELGDSTVRMALVCGWRCALRASQSIWRAEGPCSERLTSDDDCDHTILRQVLAGMHCAPILTVPWLGEDIV